MASDPLVELEATLAAIEALERPAYCPHAPHPKQRQFLGLDCLEALYGGAAGGGKSDALLMAALQHVHVPGYSALLLRRTFADLALPGALIDRSRAWLTGTDARPNEQLKRWTFPSGAQIAFGYCETEADVFRYQGAEFQFIGIDELTQWPERPYRYLLSRLRRPKTGPLSQVPIRMRAATNPGGVGHAWVKARFVSPGAPFRPFIPAKLADNPHLDVEEYENALALLDEATRDQLLHGLWVQDVSGRVYRYEDPRNVCDALPPLDAGWSAVLGVDLGASEREPTSGFCLCLWHPHDPVTYVARAWAEAGLIPSTIAERVKAVQADWPEVRVVFDEGALGKGYAQEMRARYGIPIIAAQKRDKLGYRKLLNGAFERGEVRLLRDACTTLPAELEALVWDATGTDVARGLADHISDALLYSWRQSRSYASAAPAQQPAPDSPAWWEAEAARMERAERDAWQQAQESPSWERW